MIKNVSLATLAVGSICLFAACTNTQTDPAVPSLTHANCTSAHRDVRALQNENASVTEKAIAGEKTVLPFSAVVALLAGDYNVRTPVAVEQYTLDMKKKMKQIQVDCNL